jgi:hypothetical protein
MSSRLGSVTITTGRAAGLSGGGDFTRKKNKPLNSDEYVTLPPAAGSLFSTRVKKSDLTRGELGVNQNGDRAG